MAESLSRTPRQPRAQLAFGRYAWDDNAQAFMPRAVDVLTLRAAQIQEITPSRLPGLGLPAAP